MFGLSRLFSTKPKPQPVCELSMPHAERFTANARTLFALAVSEARRARHEYLGTHHILCAFIESDDPLVRSLLSVMGTSGTVLLDALSFQTVLGPSDSFERVAVCTPTALRVLEGALCEARFLNHEFACVGHLLVGLLSEPGGLARQPLDYAGLTAERGREALMRLVPPGSA